MNMNESVFDISRGWAGQERSAFRFIRRWNGFSIDVMGTAVPLSSSAQYITMSISKEEAKELHEWLTRELT